MRLNSSTRAARPTPGASGARPASAISAGSVTMPLILPITVFSAWKPGLAAGLTAGAPIASASISAARLWFSAAYTTRGRAAAPRAVGQHRRRRRGPAAAVKGDARHRRRELRGRRPRPPRGRACRRHRWGRAAPRPRGPPARCRRGGRCSPTPVPRRGRRGPAPHPLRPPRGGQRGRTAAPRRERAPSGSPRARSRQRSRQPPGRGAAASTTRVPARRVSTSHSSGPSRSKISAASASATCQSPRAISASSWPPPHPE